MNKPRELSNSILEINTKYGIRLLHEQEWEMWDRFVFQQRDGTIFHTSIWLRHQQDRTLKIYGVFFNGELVAGLPLSIKKKAGFRVAAMPVMTPYSGPVVADVLYHQNEMQELWYTFRGALNDYDAWRVRSVHRNNALSKLWKRKEKYEVKRTNYLLRKSEHALWDGYASSLKRNIKKAKKNGISVTESQDFSTIYRLSAQSFGHSGRRHPLNEHSFLLLAEELHKFGLAKAMLAKDEKGSTLAACWMPVDRQYAYNVIHGIDRSQRDLQAGPFVLHETIKACFTSGLHVDFEGSMQDRIHVFYQKFGARETELTEVAHINSRSLEFIVKMGFKNV